METFLPSPRSFINLFIFYDKTKIRDQNSNENSDFFLLPSKQGQDTRQSSRGWLGRSDNVKTTRNSTRPTPISRVQDKNNWTDLTPFCIFLSKIRLKRNPNQTQTRLKPDSNQTQTKIKPDQNQTKTRPKPDQNQTKTRPKSDLNQT